MGAEPTGLSGNNAAPAPSSVLPLVVRARPRATRVVEDDGGGAAEKASTPSLGAPVTVPFLWEDAPGKPKLPAGGEGARAGAAHAARGGGDRDDDADDAKTRLVTPPPLKLKLPPRLQVVPSSFAARASDHHALSSPRTVLQGPYGCTGGGGGARRLRRSGTVAAGANYSFRRTPSGAGRGVGFFARMKAEKKGGGGRDPDAAAAALPADASSASPSPSSSSSSSSYASFFGDDSCAHGTCRWPADSADEGAKGSSVVRITRFRRNRSLPSMTTSHLWASIRKSVKQIAPWS